VIAVGVDIGGTFTDVVAADAETGVYHIVKVPSTPHALVEGVREGVLRVVRQAEAQTGDVVRFIHGTTVATNAVLERKGARTAILATEGFEDILEIGRLKRTRMYDLFIDAETPTFLSPKRRRRGIKERIAADGSVVSELDEDDTREVIRELLAEQGAQAFAISLLFSFRNPAHEQRVRELVRELEPNVGISLSSEVDPTFREYERTVVTAFDAYVRPVIEGYTQELERALTSIGVDAQLQIMQSRGGITSSRLISQKPVSVLLSGPAAGVIGGSSAAARSGFSDVITIDIGGTSADISLVAEGKPLVSTEGAIDGYPLRVPMIDVTAIGAGGGSIAWVDSAGGFHVGPQSAGAEPGPAAYGRGGSEATVTDASIVLGYLNPDYFAGGTMQMDAEAAHLAVATLGERLGLAPTEAAAGIHRIINTKMADAIRLVSIQRGYDPRSFALLVLGGAGPVHGGRLAYELGIPSTIVPRTPGVLSALGLLVASIEHDHTETIAIRFDEADPGRLEQIYARVDAQVSELMRAEQVPPGQALVSRFADMRYVGQSYTLEVDVPASLDETALAACVDRFHQVHERVYGHARPNAPVELLNARVVQAWRLPFADFVDPDPGPAGDRDIASSRPAYFEELGGYVETPVYQRTKIRRGNEIVGPAIVEQVDTTIVIYPRHTAVPDDAGNIIVTAPLREEDHA
jgi:N-methylhydantoinase A